MIETQEFLPPSVVKAFHQTINFRLPKVDCCLRDHSAKMVDAFERGWMSDVTQWANAVNQFLSARVVDGMVGNTMLFRAE